MKNIKILVAAHKADPHIRQDEVYLPVQVGKALHPDIDLGFQPDNAGVNISYKNGSYCELTALYWAWKNLKNVDIIGLAHYRRYLECSDKKAEEYLNKYDWILPYPFHCKFDNYVNLALLTTHEDAILAIDVLLELYPDAKNIAEKYFFQSNRYSVFNMFITSWEHFDEYCNFLFPYLERLEAKLKDHSYLRLQRTIGYIAESMLGFWMKYRKYNVKYMPTLDLSTSRYHYNIKTRLRNLQRDLGFRFGYLPKRQHIYYYVAAETALKQEKLL